VTVHSFWKKGTGFHLLLERNPSGGKGEGKVREKYEKRTGLESGRKKSGRSSLFSEETSHLIGSGKRGGKKRIIADARGKKKKASRSC